MILAGEPSPLGARWNGQGVNFAVASRHASCVELCLSVDGREETLRAALPGRTGEVFHGFVPMPLAGPGTHYGFRAQGPWRPAEGHRFNPARRLLDPAARALSDGHFDSVALRDDPDEGPLPVDTGPLMPWCVVIEGLPALGRLPRPLVPWRDTVICELHVKGHTWLDPAVPAAWRGKYLGLTTPRVIERLLRLGVTAVELLPVQEFASEPFLAERGLTNYWGYNPLLWSAPARTYAVEDPIVEFRAMVEALHAAGLEVIVDLVFNHTAEGGAGGRTLSLKGLDNATCSRLDERGGYRDVTGCGNSVDLSVPATRALLLDSLRFWAVDMGVDGFRFDLAPALARDRDGEFDPHAALFAEIRSDPDLAYAKLIAEPWDVGPGGYRLGGFPPGWAEWNDRYRDTVRAFWRGDPGQVGALAERMSGSGDLFRRGGRRPQSSINYVTSHDGFTLADLVTYSVRRNQSNLEGNADGHAENLGWNCGVEGPTAEPAVNALRRRQARNLLATLFLSRGVPMILAGDEIGRTQGGNNNAYCQDNATSWTDWLLESPVAPGADFVARLAALRRRCEALRQDRFLRQDDIRWLHPAGRTMTDDDWSDHHLRCLGLWLSPVEAPDHGLVVLMSAEPHEVRFSLPPEAAGGWQMLLDTGRDTLSAAGEAETSQCVLLARSLIVLEQYR
ncbi:MAG: glycogen debranching protein GlgX [Steroidobacteraceae bacterium]